MKKLFAPIFILAIVTIGAFVPVASANSKWQWPTEGNVKYHWGMRVQPRIHVYRMHCGIDIQNKMGTPIYSARSGRVVAINRSARPNGPKTGYDGGGYGNYVVIRHSNDLFSIYAHLSKVLAKKGQWVRAGKLIGKMGNTGLTPKNFVHLHFGIGPTLWVNCNTLNPLKVLPRR